MRDAFDNLLVYTVLETAVSERGPDEVELELQVREDKQGGWTPAAAALKPTKYAYTLPQS